MSQQSAVSSGKSPRLRQEDLSPDVALKSPEEDRVPTSQTADRELKSPSEEQLPQEGTYLVQDTPRFQARSTARNQRPVPGQSHEAWEGEVGFLAAGGDTEEYNFCSEEVLDMMCDDDLPESKPHHLLQPPASAGTFVDLGGAPSPGAWLQSVSRETNQAMSTSTMMTGGAGSGYSELSEATTSSAADELKSLPRKSKNDEKNAPFGYSV